MIEKQTVLYMLKPATQYECGDCYAYLPEDRRCLYHSFSDTFLPFDGCGLFTQGTPRPKGTTPLGLVTKQESGFARSTFGFSCKRCENFIESGDCSSVDKDSPGDTPGMIHPDACCNGWEADPRRSMMPTEAFSGNGY